MKALILKEYNNLVYTDFPKPEIKSNEVLIRVKACGICGSDVHGMDGTTGRRIPPIIMGHEASGVIVEVGAEVTGWELNDRVTFDSTIYPLNDWYTLKGHYNLSNSRKVLGVSTDEYRRHGAFAEFIAVPQHILYKIPEGVSFEAAAMVEPVAVAAHALNVSPCNRNGKFMVVGAGMIGCFVTKLLKIAGAGKIIVADIDQSKAVLAKKFGADLFLNPLTDNINQIVMEATNGRGVDQAFEVVGNNKATNTAIENVRKGGTVTLVGNISAQVEIPLQQVVTKQIRLQGSCAICGEYEEVLLLMQKGVIDTSPLLSKIAPLKDGAEWFHRLYSKEPGLNKVILCPNS
ncbi:MAG: galactitol-1-phosphate 5-dehydrogenase [Bacteroidetes bacterium]|nr:galactitol-1-phosphate 5-dehydrogenase [Bacteroidota bacterium]